MTPPSTETSASRVSRAPKQASEELRMAYLDGTRIRHAAVPAAASLAGAGIGLLLTRGSKLTEALPRPGDLVTREPMGKRELDAGELDRRRRERAQRRKQRHARG
jgi:hypothetical protein